MGAEEVVEKILADAKAEAEQIKKQAEEKQAAQQADLEKQLNEYKKQTGILAQRAAKDKKSHLLAAARMALARQLLAEKRRLLDEGFARAQTQLQNLPDDKYRKLMTKLMLAAVETGDEQVIIDKSETRINADLISEVNQQLASSDKGNLTLSSEKQNIAGGFILRRNRIKNNLSLQVLLAQARRELEIQLAKELFS